MKLYGFASALEREWFRLLQSVQGVGAKVALAVLSTFSAGDLANAIALQDKAMVARAPGIGPKVAQRIVTELKNKVPAYAGDMGEAMGLKRDLGDGVVAGPVSDAVSAVQSGLFARTGGQCGRCCPTHRRGNSEFGDPDPAWPEGTVQMSVLARLAIRAAGMAAGMIDE